VPNDSRPAAAAASTSAYGGVVAGGAEQAERRAGAGAPHRQPPVVGVEAVGERLVARHQPRREPEELHLLGRAVARPHVAQVVEPAPLGGPAEEQRVAERREVRLAEHAGHHRDGEQGEQPRVERGERDDERRERQRVLPHAQQLREQPHPPRGLPPRALELVVERRVLELREVERGGVLHEAHARRVGEAVAQQALEQRRRAGEQVAAHHQGDLERHEAPEPPGVAAAALRRDHRVDDELPDPQREHRHPGAHEPQRGHAGRVPAVRAPHEAEERGHVAERGEAVAPRHARVGAGRARRAAAAGARRARGRRHGRGHEHKLGSAAGRLDPPFGRAAAPAP
jgi:hypothetical protein